MTDIDKILTKVGEDMLNLFDKKLEKLDGFETDYVKILYYDLPKNFSGEYKTYNYSRFCTILSGRKHVTLNNNRKFMYTNDNYLLLPSNSKVHMDIHTDTKALVFELNDELVNNVLNKVNIEDNIKEEVKTDNNYFLGQNKYNILEDINNIFAASKSKDSNNEFLIDLYAQKLVFDLIKNKSTYQILNKNSSHPINIAVKYINENIEEMINIKELAKDLHMSESNFSHLFKKVVGIKPVEYIKNKKLELALEFLRNESVTDVAFNLGYANISYFIRLFKDKYNMTPKQYKLTYFEKI
ncbi:helix-turn-helix transcriptional regulator [Vallitalea sp.]|uniref:helix-turn-helix transcriptional regulator n=1 Tax=Vallitalea sp. TaxID=1882829 RepID=UPI0025FAFEC0|nr:AraC family transcriptional regulator [Vallitalea sp.]MCT4686952.1 AraC family transcriptional regulator [Vallitalea sp.]